MNQAIDATSTPAPGLATAPTYPDVYALKPVGDCMAPEINDGDPIVISSSQHPKAGDLVVVHLRPAAAARWGSEAIVKRLCHDPLISRFPWDPTRSDLIPTIVLDQLNPPRTYRIAATDILALHKVLGVGERRDGAVVAPRAMVEGKLPPGRPRDTAQISAVCHPSDVQTGQLAAVPVEDQSPRRTNVGNPANLRTSVAAQSPGCLLDLCAEHRRLNRLYRALDHKEGSTDEDYDRLVHLMAPIHAGIIETPAQTLEEIKAKGQVIRDLYDGDTPDFWSDGSVGQTTDAKLVYSILRDLGVM